MHSGLIICPHYGSTIHSKEQNSTNIQLVCNNTGTLTEVINRFPNFILGYLNVHYSRSIMRADDQALTFKKHVTILCMSDFFQVRKLKSTNDTSQLNHNHLESPQKSFLDFRKYPTEGTQRGQSLYGTLHYLLVNPTRETLSFIRHSRHLWAILNFKRCQKYGQFYLF